MTGLTVINLYCFTYPCSLCCRKEAESWDMALPMSTGKVGVEKLKFTAMGREPFTTYQVKVVAVNAVGESGQGEASDNVTTDEASKYYIFSRVFFLSIEVQSLSAWPKNK